MLKALQKKLALLTSNVGGGKGIGFSLPAENTLNRESTLTAAEAIDLMRDGLRYRVIRADGVTEGSFLPPAERTGEDIQGERLDALVDSKLLAL